ncbi:bifunctional hydroxymethylpyrimidine kinase/phosphomethylpyrimidine kinase [Microbacterium sp. M3]|uniref:Bifunctional hydroxymethylpyrimidine kinase/phosphomethylpyrimidine kinase n=1 Tax=Microbacterium arthrosphaerae TaxID=792652 RepID=A0ABU4GYG9_9MICO|nr:MULTISPECIES: bifunctional hydroxymethylpyrimidine kinase/phosphomethylpyrimidine kinase [Microbacterium]MDW4571552.1 bifunctional hydroxymethylpyrimidine kinase/phosphomethylpyrimidine kinase [Microbacterium arthrosphaerae]MDW7605407.1 bifunctional hydroxymethylpyrimidine kinase/phosphomethylpyrimidine kinase [Microbacterium sp. M3]
MTDTAVVAPIAARRRATIPRVLSIAGTDPTGGAGVQADLKSIGALGGYGMAVVTALVAQNTRGVRELHVPPVAFLVSQLEAVSDDVEIDAVKIGMLQSADIIAAVRDWLGRVRPPVVVLDPVMVATSGDRLLDPAAEDALRRLTGEVDLVTPNLAELAVLAGRARATTWAQAVEDARSLAAETGTTVLLKGGHLAGADCPDAIVTPGGGVREIAGARVATRNNHGTGCSLSSAMATLGAGGATWPQALDRAKTWLTGALEHADALRVGEGNGPIDHFHELRTSADVESWTARAWEEAAAVRAQVDDLAFVRGLGDGTLPRATFRRYLAQDALYLGEYSRVLATASALAPTPEEQAFWARSAESSIVEERRLHEAHLGSATVAPAPQTLAYTNHLHASARSYGELVAALLPCFWLYTDLGVRLAARRHDGHPYDDWLAMYAAPAFTAATARAIEIADAAARGAGPRERQRMSAAFATSMTHEREFFARA